MLESDITHTRIKTANGTHNPSIATEKWMANGVAAAKYTNANELNKE